MNWRIIPKCSISFLGAEVPQVDFHYFTRQRQFTENISVKISELLPFLSDTSIADANIFKKNLIVKVGNIQSWYIKLNNEKEIFS